MKLENLSRRERVEVADQNVKPVLMSLDSFEQRANLARAPAFIPLRKARAEMQSKHTRLAAGRNNLEKRMTRARGIMPLVILNLSTTQKPDRVISPRVPKRIFRRLGDAFNDRGIDRLLKDDKVRRRCNDRIRKRLFPAATTKADVVAQQLQRHALSPDGTTT